MGSLIHNYIIHYFLLQNKNLVDKSYADSKKIINVGYTLRGITKIKIVFDPAKLKVEKQVGSTFTAISNGDMIYERVQLRSSAINVPSNKIVYGWLLNGASANFYKYNKQIKITILKDYADSTNKINIDYNLKTLEQITINYDNSNMFCDSYISGSWQTIYPGQTVPEGERVYFNLNEVEEGKVPVWTINGKNKESYYFQFVSYFLDIDEIGSGKSVQASLSYRSGKIFTIKFDSSKIKCTKKKDNSDIPSGTKLIEGTQISFKTTDGTSVDWTIGKDTYWNDDDIDYIVFEANTDTGIIEVSYE